MLPKRNKTYGIDTLAVRRLITQMDANWVIRERSERDYRIDMTVEVFEKNLPTGQSVSYKSRGREKHCSPTKGE